MKRNISIIGALLGIAIAGNLYCTKQSPLLLPAVQKIRELPPVKKWVEIHPGIETMAVAYSQKLQDEYKQYLTDTSIVLTCRVKFKGDQEFRLLPFVNTNAADGTSAYFFVAEETRIVFYHVTGGASPAPSAPMESLSLNYTKIQY